MTSRGVLRYIFNERDDIYYTLKQPTARDLSQKISSLVDYKPNFGECKK